MHAQIQVARGEDDENKRASSLGSFTFMDVDDDKPPRLLVRNSFCVQISTKVCICILISCTCLLAINDCIFLVCMHTKLLCVLFFLVVWQTFYSTARACTHTYLHTYIYIYMCVYVSIFCAFHATTSLPTCILAYIHGRARCDWLTNAYIHAYIENMNTHTHIHCCASCAPRLPSMW